MINYTIISGSIRQSRNSHRVSLYLMERLNNESNCKVELIDLAELNLPVMTDLWDKHPQQLEAYTQLANTLKNSDAFIWVSPEYNGSYTPALKNFIDHFPKNAFYRKPVGVVSVSTGSLGGIRGGINMQELAIAVQAYALPQMLLVPQVITKFDLAGALTDSTYLKQIDTFITELKWLSDALKSKVVSGQ